MNRYLIMIRGNAAPINPTTLMCLREELQKISDRSCELLFSTKNADFFCLTLKSDKTAIGVGRVVSEVFTPIQQEFFMVVEISDNLSYQGVMNTWRFLQH